MAVNEWLWMQQPDLYSDGFFFKFVANETITSIFSGIMLKTNDTWVNKWATFAVVMTSHLIFVI
jgi:hypothetical protein